MTEYDRGFGDGLKFVATCLRRSATIIGTPTYSDFTRNDGYTHTAISNSGDIHFAKNLRIVAQMLEDAANGTNPPPPN
jgi:hypothetical protein